MLSDLRIPARVWVAYSVFKTGNNDGDKDTILKHTTVYILIFRRLCLIKVDRCIIDCDIPPGGWLVEDAAGSKAGPAGTVRQPGVGGSSSVAAGPRATEHRGEVVLAPQPRCTSHRPQQEARVGVQTALPCP